ncbi:MAG: ATP-binding protein [Bacteroidota bacterium]
MLTSTGKILFLQETAASRKLDDWLAGKSCPPEEQAVILVLALREKEIRIYSKQLSYRLQVVTEDCQYEPGQIYLIEPTLHFSIEGHFIRISEFQDGTSAPNQIKKQPGSGLHGALTESIPENLEDSIIAMDASLNIRSINTAAIKLFGKLVEHLVGQSLTQLFTARGQNPELVQSYVQTAWEGEKVFFNTKGKQWIGFRYSPLTDSQGDIIGYLEVARDITLIRERALELERSVTLQKAILNHSSHHYFLFDPQEKLILCNRNARERMRQMYGQEITQSSTLREICGDENYLFFKKVFQEALQNRETTGTMKRETPKGTKWGQYRYNRVEDENGNLLGVSMSLVDVTHLKEAEATIVRTNQQFQLASETAGIGFWDMDILNGNLNFDERMYQMFGREVADAVSPNDFWFNQIDEKDRNRVESAFMDIAQGKCNLDETFGIVSARGQSRYLRITGSYHQAEDNQNPKIFGLAWDVTPQQLAAKEMQRSKELAEEMVRLKSNFLANMSHEIRTPLNGIIGLLSLLRLEEDREEMEQIIEMMDKSGTRLLNTLTSVLDLAKVEAEKQQYELKELDLNQLLHEIFDGLNSMAIPRQLDYQFHPHRTQPKVLGDPGMFSQIFTNLIGNALKFTEGGSVEVKVRLKRRSRSLPFVVVEIIDTGIGISAEALENIFEPFRQESQGDTRRFEGSGLGLSIAKKYTELMGGNISCKSEKGVGSVFSVYLPLHLQKS